MADVEDIWDEASQEQLDAKQFGRRMHGGVTNAPDVPDLRGSQSCEPRPEKPLGAIHNGRTHIARLVEHYDFTCGGGGLEHCQDYIELARCFEALAEYVARGETPPNDSIEGME